MSSSTPTISASPYACMNARAKLDISTTVDENGLNIVSSTPAIHNAQQSYEIWRSTTPYFTAGDSGSTMLESAQGTNIVFVDPESGVGNVNVNHAYVIRTFCDNVLASEKRIGEFDYRLMTTGTTDFNWVGVPLILEGVTTAAALVNHIELNSSRSLDVLAVEQWNPVSQSYDSYLPDFPFLGDIAVNTGQAYRIIIELTDEVIGDAIWTLVGDIPEPATFDYTLHATGSTNFNWVLAPLDKPALNSGSALNTDAQSNTPSIPVVAVERWNTASQSFDIYLPTLPILGDVPIQMGHAYRISLDMPPGTVHWQ
ncbi:MAG: hypothetical protein AAF639_32960 [Chloroflexota bacterium]